MSLEIEIRLTGPPASGKSILLGKVEDLLSDEGFTGFEFVANIDGEFLKGRKEVP